MRFSRNGTNNELKNINISYPFSNNETYKDNLLIKEKSIKLVAKRSKKNDLDNILHNTNKTLVRQITKSIAYYYCVLGENNEITSISLSRHLNKTLQDKKTIYKKDISQIVSKYSDLSILLKIKESELITIFQENSKGHSILFAITHLINSCASSKAFDKFEKAWKCFNSIYREKQQDKQQDKKDFECLRLLRTRMMACPSDYPLSTVSIHSLTKDEIFCYVNWRSMILDSFPTEKHAKNFKGFVERQNDVRILEKINDTLILRETLLKNGGVYSAVIDYINSKISTNSHFDVEIVAFLCLKYMYHLRNKIVHAERIDPSFHLIADNSEEEEKIRWNTDILVRLIIDLINFNSRWQTHN